MSFRGAPHRRAEPSTDGAVPGDRAGESGTTFTSDGIVQTLDLNLQSAGGPVRCRLYRPVEALPHSALVWLHGGGFVSGSIDMREGDAVSRAFARVGILVLSVDYRRVPPRSRARMRRGVPAIRYPVPVDDCIAGWRHLVGECVEADIPPQRTFVGGASAGGNLAAMTALRSVAAGLPAPAGVLLAYPLLHATMPIRDTSARSGPFSSVLAAFTNRAVIWMGKCFVGAANVDRLDEAFPRSEQLARFPPTVIVTSQSDGLRPSGEAFAEDLRRSGVPVEIRTEPGTRHGHLNLPGRPAFEHTISTFTDWIRAEPR